MHFFNSTLPAVITGAKVPKSAGNWLFTPCGNYATLTPPERPGFVVTVSLFNRAWDASRGVSVVAQMAGRIIHSSKVYADSRGIFSASAVGVAIRNTSREGAAFLIRANAA